MMALPRCGLRLQKAKAHKRQLHEDYSATRAESDLLHRRSAPGNIYKAVKIHLSVLHKVHARHSESQRSGVKDFCFSLCWGLAYIGV